MRYVQIGTPDTVIEHVVDTLLSHLLLGEHVAWFLSGGSAIGLEVRIAQALQTHDVSRLHIGLVDERYGRLGHKDENYVQLTDAYFPLFIRRVLTGSSAEATAQAYDKWVQQTLGSVDFSLGIFGIGADGHTAGIKPHSPATKSTKVVTTYQGDDHQRITLTPKGIRRLDEAVIYAAGTEKLDTLRALLHQDLPLDEQPAQVLKTVKTSTLYTNISLE